MRKRLVDMAVRLGVACDFSSGQASLRHATAADILPLRPRAVRARVRATLGRDLSIQRSTSAAHKWSAASASARPAQTHAYSADYGHDNTATALKLETMQWNPLAANAISLIGNTGRDVEVKHLQTGRIVGHVTLACSHKPGETSWYDISLWGPLAERVAAQVPKGSQVCIQGKLAPYTYTNQAGIKQTKFQITGTEVRIVEKYNPAAPLQNSFNQAEGEQSQASGASGGGQMAASSQGSEWGTSNNSIPLQQNQAAGVLTKESSPEEKWKSVFETPNLWWDNTTNKRNPRGPDYKLKNDPTGMVALWIDSRDTPAWVKEQLEKAGVMSVQPSQYTDMN